MRLPWVISKPIPNPHNGTIASLLATGNVRHYSTPRGKISGSVVDTSEAQQKSICEMLPLCIVSPTQPTQPNIYERPGTNTAHLGSSHYFYSLFGGRRLWYHQLCRSGNSGIQTLVPCMHMYAYMAKPGGDEMKQQACGEGQLACDKAVEHSM